MSEIFASGSQFAWGWGSFLFSLAIFLLGKYGENEDLKKLIGWGVPMPSPNALKVIAVAIAFGGAFYSFHQMRMSYATTLAAATSELERSKTTITTLDGVVNALASSKENSLEVLSAAHEGRMVDAKGLHRIELEEKDSRLASLNSELTELRGPRWATVRHADQIADGQRAFIYETVVLPGRGHHESPAAITLSCTCELLQTQLKIDGVFTGMVSNPAPEPIASNKVRWVVSAPQLSESVVLRLHFASRTSADGVHVNIGSP